MNCKHKMRAPECVAVPWTFNSGCRTPKVRLPSMGD